VTEDKAAPAAASADSRIRESDSRNLLMRIAVAAVLSYRLATFWLPILPGWLSFNVLERRHLI